MKSAARAAIVIPAVFAIADQVIQNPQTAIFAAFGSFAMLVFAEFSGSAASRFMAYLTLAAVGAANVTVGTLCSVNVWLAVVAMALVAFAILMLGAVNGYVAAAGTAAMLSFILPVTIPAAPSAIPQRLEGWGLASAAAICALMLLWPPRPTTLRGDGAAACRALADLVDANLADPRTAADQSHTAREAIDAFGQRVLNTPHRPTGPTGPTAALAALADELDWLLSFLVPKAEGSPIDVCPDQNAEAMAATASVLRASAASLDGRSAHPDLSRLDEARDALAQALAQRIPQLPAIPDDQSLASAVHQVFRIRAIAYAARQSAGYALRASDRTALDADYVDTARGPSAAQTPRSAYRTIERLAAEHAGAGSIWFRNSIRGAVALAVAVYIADEVSVQHDFWIVLGTLSVLRSNALSTGSSILSALGGTALGILFGAGIVIGIGDREALLWAVLPVAILFAAHAPRVVSFAAGQAGFTVVLVVLFNLIQPAGWQVGLVRIEDVAIGCAVSLGVGLLFWPRGAAMLLRENLAAAYARSADYVLALVRQVGGRGDATRSNRAAQDADAALHRLNDAFRQYLAERSPKRLNMDSIGALVAGATRVRRVAHSLEALDQLIGDKPRLVGCGENLDAEVHGLRSWYVTFGDALVNATAVPPPHLRDEEGRRRLLSCVRDAVASSPETLVRPALVLLWTEQYLDSLWRLESHLAHHAATTERSDGRPSGAAD